jgi:hypothetical protein
MQLTIEIPDSMANSIFEGGVSQDRRALELLALEGYRLGNLSRGQVGKALGMGYFETEEFLHKHGAFIDYTIEDFEKGSEVLSRYMAKKKAAAATTAG